MSYGLKLGWGGMYRGTGGELQGFKEYFITLIGLMGKTVAIHGEMWGYAGVRPSQKVEDQMKDAKIKCGLGSFRLINIKGFRVLGFRV